MPSISGDCACAILIDLGGVKQSFFTHGIEIGNFEGVTIDNFHGGPAPCSAKAHSIYLHDGKIGDVRGDTLSVVKKGVD